MLNALKLYFYSAEKLPEIVEDPSEQFEIVELDDEPEQQAAWLPEVSHNNPPLPAFHNHGRKRRPKLSKAEKKSRRHIRAMWP